MGFESRLLPVHDAGSGILRVGDQSLGRTLSLQDMRNSCQGDVLVLASGPSAAQFPLADHAGIPCITMNGSIQLAERAAVRPLVYLCDDPSFVRDRPGLALGGLRQAAHLAMTLDCLGEMESQHPGCLATARTLVLERVNRQAGRPRLSDRRFAWQAFGDPDLECGFSLWRSKPNRIGFSRNLCKGYFGSRTVPFAALQLAYHLGFSRAFLIGVDLDPTLGRFYEQGADALPSTLDSDFEDYILPSFRLLSRRVVRPGRFEVFNLSPHSRLPGRLIPKLAPEAFARLLQARRSEALGQ